MTNKKSETTSECELEDLVLVKLVLVDRLGQAERQWTKAGNPGQADPDRVAQLAQIQIVTVELAGLAAGAEHIKACNR